MGMIPGHIVQQIIESAYIEEVIGEFVHLKKSGSNYKAHSPFVDEKTPSFMVSPAKQIFKCFSSGKGGNVVSFLMEHEKWTYPEALRWLAKKYNIEVEEEKLSDTEIAARSERESLAALNRFANDFFSTSLHESSEGQQIGLSYFKERGFSKATIDKFELGYNPEKSEGITAAALKAQYSEKFLLAAGLSKEGRNGLYDFLRGRVIFPIHNISGQIVGFGARTLKSDKKIPKYLNSPENALYNKSKILYGLYQAKNQITKDDQCFLVEGYTDVISLHQNGIENVLASSGTSLTTDQVKLIKRYTKNVTILFDGDSAGIKASFRGINLFLQEGLTVKACLFPNGEDPDSFAKAHSVDEIHDFIKENSKDFVSFKASILLKDHDLKNPAEKVAVLREMAETIAQISDPLSRNVYCKTSADLLETEEQVLLKEINRHLRNQARGELKKSVGMAEADFHIQTEESLETPEKPSQKQVEGFKGSEIQERDLLRLLVLHGDKEFIYRESSEEGETVEALTQVRSFILSLLEADDIDFDIPIHQRMLNLIKENEQVDQAIHQSSDQELTQFYADLITPPYQLSPNWELKHQIEISKEEDKLNSIVPKTLYTYQLAKVESEIKNIQEQLKTNGDEATVISLLEEQKEYENAKKQLSKILARVILR